MNFVKNIIFSYYTRQSVYKIIYYKINNLSVQLKIQKNCAKINFNSIIETIIYYLVPVQMIQKIIKIWLFFILFWQMWIAIAANVDHFEITVSPDKVAVWEALDMTIDVVDKDNNLVTDYEGTILIFSESDKEAEFPNSLEDNSYTFQVSDGGTVKFENAVKFNNKWKNDIHVYDLSDETNSVLWIAEVEVTEEIEEKKLDISILSPENWITIWSKEVTVSGTSKKNHQVKIILNNDEEILTTTNNSGIFEKTISGLPNGESIIKAYVLDSDWVEVWASEKVLITSDSTKPTLNSVKFSPEWELQPESDLLIEVYATKGLSEVQVILDEALNILKEDSPWLYKSDILTPKEPGEYEVEVILKDELGHITKQKADNKILVWEAEVELTAAPKPEPKPEKVKDVCKNGDYTWDVFDWECWEEPVVELNAPVDLGIRNLELVQLKTKSILTWDTLKDATSYEVYKKTEGWKLELIDTIKEARYEVNIVWDEISYEYFAVKALWKKEFIDTENKNEKIQKDIQWDLSDAVKIQTWPEMFIIIIVAFLISIWIFLFNRRKEIEL